MLKVIILGLGGDIHGVSEDTSSKAMPSVGASTDLNTTMDVVFGPGATKLAKALDEPFTDKSCQLLSSTPSRDNKRLRGDDELEDIQQWLGNISNIYMDDSSFSNTTLEADAKKQKIGDVGTGVLEGETIVASQYVNADIGSQEENNEHAAQISSSAVETVSPSVSSKGNNHKKSHTHSKVSSDCSKAKESKKAPTGDF